MSRTLVAFLLVLGSFLARGADREMSVTSAKASPWSVVTMALPGGVSADSAILVDGEGKEVPVQADTHHGKPALTFIVTDAKAGETRKFHLREGKPTAMAGVEIKPSEKGMNVLFDGKLFTTYQITDKTKPYLWPILGPTGKKMTRSYPMETVKGEVRDHYHHQGMWIGFEPINGINFWSVSPTAGKCFHKEFSDVVSGPVYGQFRSRVEWVDRKGGEVAEDLRTYRFYRTPDARIIDVQFTLTPAGVPLTFSDNKEGFFSIRVPESMKLGRQDNPGTILNAAGDKDKDTWGKRSAWCDYSGPVEGETLGIAIFDAPTNFRHPTYWHVRDYGLFGANPFGIRHFTGDENQDGSHIVPANGSFDASYRVYFHKGHAGDARVSEWYDGFADPPKATPSGS